MLSESEEDLNLGVRLFQKQLLEKAFNIRVGQYRAKGKEKKRHIAVKQSI
jgi:hypothetical protein